MARILAGEDEGTFFVPNSSRLTSRKRWIAFYHHAAGTLVVDDGAKRALRDQARSLLGPGISRIEGEFGAGDVVRICDTVGHEFARGLARVGATELRAGSASRREVVHRDDLVVL